MTLKKFLKSNLAVSSVITLSFIIIINNFFRFFKNNSVYEFDTWLSNWQGGFVRRGIPGEFLFQIHEIFSLHLGWLVFIFVTLLYFSFYLAFFYLIKKINLNKIFIFTIFSPVGFYFPVLNSKGSGQKEIFFLCLFALFCLTLPKLTKVQAKYILAFIMLLVGLSHEGFIFYFTYLIIPFLLFFNFKNFKDLVFNLTPLFFIALGLLLLTYHFNGSEKHVISICSSVKDYVNIRCEEIGQIAALGFIKNVQWNVTFTETIGRYDNTFGLPLFPKYFLIYGIGFIVGFLPLIILFSKSKLIGNRISLLNLHPLLFFSIPLIFTAPIYYAGFDWGRYLYTSYMCSMILFIFCINNNIFDYKDNTITKKDHIFKKWLFIIIIIIYGFGWTVPICCELNFKPGISSVFSKAISYYNIK